MTSMGGGSFEKSDVQVSQMRSGKGSDSLYRDFWSITMSGLSRCMVDRHCWSLCKYINIFSVAILDQVFRHCRTHFLFDFDDAKI